MPLPDLRAIYSRDSIDPSVMVADGSNVSVTVRKNQLTVTDGVRSQRRERRISGADNQVSRLIILGTTGYVSLEAFNWCMHEGICIYQLDRDGNIAFTSPGMTSQNLKLRQIQSLMSAGYGPASMLDVLKYLTVEKMTGQFQIVSELFKDQRRAAVIGNQISYANTASLDSLIGYEAKAAVYYWQAWKGRVSVPFSPRDMLDVPSHWLTFRTRVSEPGATDPVNAMLNYAYRIAETEAILACHVCGLDPMIGLGHRLRDGRNSLALDIMEVARPLCDRIVLSMLDYGQGIPYDNRDRPVYFPANWLYEIRHGVTQLFAPLTHKLAESVSEISRVIQPAAARVAGTLAQAAVQPGSQHVRPVVRVHGSFGVPRKPGSPPKSALPVPSEVADIVPDDAWFVIAGQIPAKVMSPGGGGVQTIDDRLVIAAIVWCASNGLPLRRATSVFVSGSNSTLYRRRKEWRACGAWPDIVGAINRTVLPGFTGQ